MFKAYDIRGVYGTEIDADVACRIGQAFAELIKGEVKKDKIEIGVAHDMRLSSPELYEKIIEGIVAQGLNVVKLGLLSTPSFYFAVAKHGLDAGIQISASHNPAEFNGFKMVRHSAIPVSGDSGIMDIKDMVMANTFETADSIGEIRELNGLIEEHVEYAMKYVDINKLKPFKVVVDSANSMGGPLFEALFKHLPCELIHLNAELDGTFPAHEADPLKDENNKQLQEKVLSEQADLGIAFDGDADRIFFVTNEGVTVEPAIIRGILSMLFLRKNPGAKICYDVRPGKITSDMIEENGGVPIVTKVGHSLIKEKAREVGAVFAGESSGHFFVKTEFGIFEMPMICAMMLMQELSENDKTFSEYVKPLYRYSHSGEINFEVEDKDAVFVRLRQKYAENLKYDFDGLSFEWPDWWFNVRPSNTENKVRLNLEAVSDEIMGQKLEEVKKVIVG